MDAEPGWWRKESGEGGFDNIVPKLDGWTNVVKRW